MLKFFRKIRRNLLKENKLSQYLIYALGEILLVVLGILIALQINTWNNKKIASQQMATFLQEIKEDLIRDTLAFEKRINVYTKLLEDKKRILSLRDYQNIPNENLTDILVSGYSDYEINSTTFDKTKNLGIFNISENDSLSQSIYNYYTKTVDNFNAVLDFDIKMTNLEGEYWYYNQNEFEMRFTDEFPAQQNERSNRAGFIKIISEPKGRNHLLRDYERKKGILAFYQFIKNQAKELINALEQESSKN